MKQIKITCKAADSVDIQDFYELQGKLKDLTQDSYDKLKESIIQYGFSFPVLCWKDNKGKRWIVDAHSRIKVLKNLVADGWDVPPVPTAYIDAKDKREAKKKLLLLNSHYGKITDEGLYEYLNEPGYELDLSEFDGLLDLPDLDLDSYKAGYENDIEEEIKEKEFDENIETEHECPSCGYKW